MWALSLFIKRRKEMGNLYMYINKDGNPFIKSKRHVDATVNTRKGNQEHQNNSNSNEVEDVMLKGHPMPQVSY
jgi:hypothetical protein